MQERKQVSLYLMSLEQAAKRTGVDEWKIFLQLSEEVGSILTCRLMVYCGLYIAALMINSRFSHIVYIRIEIITRFIY